MSQDNTTVVWENVDTSNVIYESPEKNKNSGYSTEIFYKLSDTEKIKLKIQTPTLHIFKEITVGKNGKCYIEFNLEDCLEFEELLKKIDEKNVLVTTEYSKEWFGKEIPMNVIDDMYRTPVTSNTKKKTIKIKVDVVSKEPQVEIFDGEGKEINLLDLNNNLEKKVTAVIEFMCMIFYRKQFIPRWRLNKVNVVNQKIEYMFCDDDLYKSDDEYLLPYDSDYDQAVNEDETENTNESENTNENENDEVDITDLDSLLKAKKKNEKKNNHMKELEDAENRFKEAQENVERLRKELEELDQ